MAKSGNVEGYMKKIGVEALVNKLYNVNKLVEKKLNVLYCSLKCRHKKDSPINILRKNDASRGSRLRTDSNGDRSNVRD